MEQSLFPQCSRSQHSARTGQVACPGTPSPGPGIPPGCRVGDGPELCITKSAMGSGSFELNCCNIDRGPRLVVKCHLARPVDRIQEALAADQARPQEFHCAAQPGAEDPGRSRKRFGNPVGFPSESLAAALNSSTAFSTLHGADSRLLSMPALGFSPESANCDQGKTLEKQPATLQSIVKLQVGHLLHERRRTGMVPHGVAIQPSWNDAPLDGQMVRSPNSGNTGNRGFSCACVPNQRIADRHRGKVSPCPNCWNPWPAAHASSPSPQPPVPRCGHGELHFPPAPFRPSA